MLNLFLASLVLCQWLLLEWLVRQGPRVVRQQARKLYRPWQAHSLFAAWALWFHGLAQVERFWLRTLWPEAWMGLAILVTLGLVNHSFVRIVCRLLKVPGHGSPMAFLAILWLGGWFVCYGLAINPTAGLLAVALLAGGWCSRGQIHALPAQLVLWLTAAWITSLFLQHPEAAMRIADTLPAHYNSLAVAGLVLPWVLLPLWLVLPWLNRGRLKDHTPPLYACQARMVASNE